MSFQETTHASQEGEAFHPTEPRSGGKGSVQQAKGCQERWGCHRQQRVSQGSGGSQVEAGTRDDGGLKTGLDRVVVAELERGLPRNRKRVCTGACYQDDAAAHLDSLVVTLEQVAGRVVVGLLLDVLDRRSLLDAKFT